MPKTTPLSKRAGCALGLAATLALPQIARADLRVWNGGGANNNWSNPNNWSSFFGPPANDGTDDIIMQGTLRPMPNVDINFDILSLQFSGGGGAGPFSIFNSGGAGLSIRDGGIVNNDTDLQTIGRVALGANHTWNAANGPLRTTFLTLGSPTIARALTVTGAFDTTITGNIFGAGLAGSGSIVMNGSANLQLGGTGGLSSNTFTGPITVNSGTLLLNKFDGGIAVPGNLIIGDGAGSDVVKLLRGGQIAATSNVTINSSGLLDLNGFGEGFANLTMTGSTVTGGAGTITVTGAITTNASPNTARIIARRASTPMYTVADGAAEDDLSVSTQIGQGLSVVKNGAGQMRFQGTTSVVGAGMSAVVNAGTLILGTDFATLDILTVGDGVGGTGADVARCEITFMLHDQSDVIVNESGLLDFDGHSQLLAPVRLRGGQMTLGAATITTQILKAESSSATARVSGGTLVLDNALPTVPGSLVGENGTSVVDLEVSSALVSNGGLTISGGGAIVISGQHHHANGSLLISGTGTVTFNTDAGGGPKPPVTSSAFLNFASTQHLASLDVTGGRTSLVTGGSRSLVASSVTVDTTDALIDVWEHAIIVDYSGASPLASIKSAITTAYNNGSWNGFGITSSLANNSSHGVGYAESGAIFTSFPATFAGETVDDTAVLVRFTRYGDANLDQVVNLADFNRLAANFGTSSGATWSMGDFTYDGIVNLSDFNRLAANFGLSAGPDGVVDPQDWANLAAAVPEPAGLSLLAAAGVMLTRPRRRQLARAALFAAPLIGAALHPSHARAGNVWDGGGSNNNWTTGANWNFDNQPPPNNGLIDVVMAGSVRPSPNVNVPYDIRGLIFNFDADFFTLGGQELTIRAGGILQGDTQTQTINNAIQVEASQTWDAFSGPLLFNGGTVNLGGLTPHTLNVSGDFFTTINGRIEGLGQLVKFGTSQLTLSGTTANTYIGATIVNSGTVVLNKPASVTAISASNLTIGDGTGTDVVRLIQNHQIADTANVTINSSGLLDLNVRTETIANLTINGGSVATSGETFRVNGSLALNSGTYLASGQTLSVGSMQVGFNGNGRFVHRAGFFSSVSCFGDLRVGNGASGSGQYDLHSGELGVVGTISIGGAGTGRYVQTGGLALVQYVVNDGSMQISGGQFTASALDGTGSLSVTGTGMLSVTRIRQGGGLTITGANPRVRIGPNGTTLALSRVGALDLGAAPGAITGRLDLTNNDLIIDYTTVSPLPTVRQYIASGYNAGAWDGAGINASMGNSSTLGLGYVEASDIFTTFPASYLGHSVDGTTVIVSFRRYGDANIDGVVNLDDFNRLAANFGSTSATWSQGDFNYDSVVNLTDFNLLASNFGLSAGPDGVVDPSDWVAMASAVPEPALVIPALFGSTVLRCRRRRVASRCPV